MVLTLVTGGARSGKSTFAEALIQSYVSEKNQTDDGREAGVLYIATAIPYDAEMEERICRHQAQRPSHWRTVEQYQGLSQLLRDASEEIVLLDCITVMLTNLLFTAGLDEDHPSSTEVNRVEDLITQEVDDMLAAIQANPQRKVVLVTNELGLGLVPAYPLGRIFRDIAGRINQRLAAASDQVYFVISGLPMQIKGGEGR